MPIESNSPTVLPSEERIYDKWWIPHTTHDASKINRDLVISVIMRKYRVRGDGKNEYSPTDPQVAFDIAGVYGIAAGDKSYSPLFAAAITAYVAAIEAYARAEGHID